MSPSRSSWGFKLGNQTRLLFVKKDTFFNLSQLCFFLFSLRIPFNFFLVQLLCNLFHWQRTCLFRDYPHPPGENTKCGGDQIFQTFWFLTCFTKDLSCQVWILRKTSVFEIFSCTAVCILHTAFSTFREKKGWFIPLLLLSLPAHVCKVLWPSRGHWLVLLTVIPLSSNWNVRTSSFFMHNSLSEIAQNSSKMCNFRPFINRNHHPITPE